MQKHPIVVYNVILISQEVSRSLENRLYQRNDSSGPQEVLRFRIISLG